jgi:hypothetical protein
LSQITADIVGPIMTKIADARGQASAQFRANLLVNISTLTLLIDAGVMTTDAAVERIEKTRQDFVEIFEGEDVAKWMTWATDFLRGQVPLHGSMLQQQMQIDQRKAGPTQSR